MWVVTIIREREHIQAISTRSGPITFDSANTVLATFELCPFPFTTRLSPMLRPAASRLPNRSISFFCSRLAMNYLSGLVTSRRKLNGFWVSNRWREGGPLGCRDPSGVKPHAVRICAFGPDNSLVACPHPVKILDMSTPFTGDVTSHFLE